MTVDEQKVFQAKLFDDRFKIIERTNALLVEALSKAKVFDEDMDRISKLATIRYHFYSELMDVFDRQVLSTIQGQEQNAYLAQGKGGNA